MHDPGQESIDFNELYCRFTLSEEERTLLSGKKTQLTERSNSVLKQLSSNNYIFLSGWDKKLDSLQKLRTPDVKCRFIITSSNEFVEDPSCDLPIIKIDLESRRAKEDACAIMRSIIGDDLARDDEIEEFCEMIGYHTYTLVLIATQLYHKRLRINSKGITKLSEVTEHFKDVKSMNSTESGLTIISIVERLKMSLRLGFESVEDEEFRKLLQKVIILISFFHPDYINDDVLGNFVPWAGAYCFSDTINWLVEMSYLRRNKDRSLSVHPLISEVAYALFDGIDKEDAASIESVLFDYLNKRISDISTSISKYYFTNKIVFKQGESEREELVEQLKHIYFRRLTGFSIEKKARTCFRLGLLSESDVSKSYYADCEQYAWEGLSNPDLEPDKVFLLGELVMSSTWNRSGNNKKEMRNAIERLSQYKEYRTICRCAEEMLDIKDMPNARKLYAEALALSCVQAENNSAQRKIFAEMMKYCKSAAPMVSYNHCQQAIETIEAELDDRLNAEAQNYITELQKTMAEIERKAKDYCTSYVNKANIYDSKINRDKINWTMVRQEYICLVQAIELARLVNDFDDMQYIQNLIDDLLKITNTNADVCADITDEEIEDAHECS